MATARKRFDNPALKNWDEADLHLKEIAEIDIQLFTDSAKDVEIFLLNHRIDFSHTPPRTPRAEAVLTLPIDGAEANLVIYPRDEERRVIRGRDGRPRMRARLAEVRRLISAAAESPAT